ncbi:hypothetical protein VIGAN_07126500 [Vigna angularis var. angularis]|uniref:Uncharacterized protein n=1 Tax=Vigna angularis var. angularis TaxID=157739 RepID=A0A0S3SI51_PHAAN|nr:hypothetical protein VIGAN_07126500 [Vigna angularis var. angularis]
MGHYRRNLTFESLLLENGKRPEPPLASIFPSFSPSLSLLLLPFIFVPVHHCNLVDQNHRKPPSPSPAAVFHIKDRSLWFFHQNFIYQKKYIVAILAFLLVILFLSVANFQSIFSSSSFQFDSVYDPMKESELHVINLLRRQQLGLLSDGDNVIAGMSTAPKPEDEKVKKDIDMGKDGRGRSMKALIV